MVGKQRSKTKIPEKKREDRTLITKTSFEPINVESRTAETIILMLSSNEHSVLLQALASLDNYAIKATENLQQLYKLSVVEKLLPLLKNDNICIRRFSTKLLAELCSLLQVKMMLIEDESIVPYFVEILNKDDDIIIQEFSSLLLAEISSECSASEKILKNSAVSILLARMTSVDPDVQRNNLQIMANILQDPICAERYSQSEDFKFEPILALLQSEYPAIQQLAIRSILYLVSRVQDMQLHERFRKSKGIELLLDILEEKEWKILHHNVLTILETCTLCEETASNMCGYLDRLKIYMDNINDYELAKATLAVVVKLSELEEGRQILHEMNIEKQLCEILKDNRPELLLIACEGLACMSLHPESRHSIVSNNPLKDLVAVIKNDLHPKETRLSAAHAMSELLKLDKRFCAAMLEEKKQDCFDCLLYLLLGKIPVELSTSLVMSLKYILSYEEIRAKLLDSKLIEALLFCFQDAGKGDEELKVQTCCALANVMYENAARKQFLKLGGISSIMTCLKHGNLALRLAAAKLIQGCANSHGLTTAFIHAGTLEWLLQERQLRTRYECPVWETTIEELLKGNLSVKFAYTSRLDPIDVTCEGFYVTQHVEQPFPILEDLLTARVSPIRPIYVANFISIKEYSSSDYIIGHKTTAYTMSSTEALSCKSNLPQHQESTMNGRPSVDYASVKPVECEASHGMCAFDPYLLHYLIELQAKLNESDQSTEFRSSHTHLLENRARILAEFVCKQMSGPDYASNCNGHTQELHLNEIKIHLATNVIPIGYIRVGLYLERAMLFKVLADRVGLPCALVREKSHRAWVEVPIPEYYTEEEIKPLTPVESKSISFLTTLSAHLLQNTAKQTRSLSETNAEYLSVAYYQNFSGKPSFKVNTYMVVDLMDNVGKLYPVNSYEGLKYCNKLNTR